MTLAHIKSEGIDWANDKGILTLEKTPESCKFYEV